MHKQQNIFQNTRNVCKQVFFRLTNPAEWQRTHGKSTHWSKLWNYNLTTTDQKHHHC